ncbi:MAG: SDR family oxidoreductase [Candidatus Nealsonbacteria bacterium]|nr:SDR family oxidoreductase [Candidatus Nealsonbacteria bacterium]
MSEKNQKILVTGGAGYIGSVLVKTLLEKGYKVRVLDQLIFTDEPIKEILNRIELIKGDVCTVGSEILDGIDGVIHLAGFSTEPVSQYNPRYTDLLNHLATERLARFAKERGIKRFIFSSSCSVYFTYNTPPDPAPSKETDNINPISAYSLSKRSAEQALLEIADDSFQPTIFRKGTVCGWSPRMRFDLILNAFTKDAFSKQLLTVDAGGQVWRPIIDIHDVISAYAKALELPLEKIGGKIFNISSDNWNAGVLAEKVKEIVKKNKGIDIGINTRPVNISRNYKADNTLFKETFQFTPSRSLEEIVFEIWEHLEKSPDIAQNIIHYNDKWHLHLMEQQKTKTALI